MRKTLLVSAAIAGLLMANTARAEEKAPPADTATAPAEKSKCKGAHGCDGSHMKKDAKAAPTKAKKKN